MGNKWYPKETHLPKWIAAECLCAMCLARWVAVYPDTALFLECPRCGYENKREDELAK